MSYVCLWSVTVQILSDIVYLWCVQLLFSNCIVSPLYSIPLHSKILYIFLHPRPMTMLVWRVSVKVSVCYDYSHSVDGQAECWSVCPHPLPAYCSVILRCGDHMKLTPAADHAQPQCISPGCPVAAAAPIIPRATWHTSTPSTHHNNPIVQVWPAATLPATW